jgi:hypothetical protein
MKSLLIPILFKLLFVDIQTNEKLAGVKIETDNETYYSNFSGEVIIPKTEKIKRISYVSYETKETFQVLQDTLISLKQIN